MIFSPLFWVFVATFAIAWYLNRKKDPKMAGLKEIPGPRPWPIVGNTLQLGKLQHKQFKIWTDEYGDIYQMKLGSLVNIVISDAKLMKEMFSNDPNYVGRPHLEGFDLYEDTTLGLVNTEGELWEVHRRFLLRQLRDFGFGKSAMQNLILEEVDEVLSTFKKEEGKPITDIKKKLHLAVINSLWTVVSSKRYKHDDPKLIKLFENTNKVVQDLFESGNMIVFFIPWLRNIIPELSGYNAFRRIMKDIQLWFEEEVEERKRTFQEGNIRDFIDAYLTEMYQTTDPKSVFYGKQAERQLVASLADMFFAGSDTTSTTLAWAVLYLCKFSHIQRKFQQEITSVTGDTRKVSVQDRPNMPYTLGLIDEIFRYSSIVAVGVQHRALESKEFRGYYIPKDAMIMPNLHSMHHNPKIWGDPEIFRPERFLSQDGKTYQKNENLVPFQIGRRQCVGETLARDSIFLFLTNLFQRFEISFDPNSPDPTLEVKPMFLLQPQPYTVIVKDRLQ